MSKETKKPVKTTHQITIEISDEEIRKHIHSLLTCALEGGSNYWIKLFDVKRDAKKSGIDDKDGIFYADHCMEGEVKIHCYEYYGPRKINWDVCLKGYKIFAKKYPRHWADIRDGNDDADTGDCYLQTCLYGEEVFA